MGLIQEKPCQTPGPALLDLDPIEYVRKVYKCLFIPSNLSMLYRYRSHVAVGLLRQSYDKVDQHGFNTLCNPLALSRSKFSLLW